MSGLGFVKLLHTILADRFLGFGVQSRHFFVRYIPSTSVVRYLAGYYTTVHVSDR